jgi:hypothetical protein
MVTSLMRRGLAVLATIAGVVSFMPFAIAQPTPFKTFPTAEAAADAFADAVRHDDERALLAMLGTGWRVFVPSLKDDSEGHRERFLAAWDESHKVVQQGDVRAVIEVGTTGFVMPMPIVKDTGGWRFDVVAGAKEIQARHIGHDELTVVQTLLAIVDAEREYAALDPSNSGVRAYAQRVMSHVGKKDGLYWPVRDGETKSPLGSMLAKADATDSTGRPAVFYGYHFRVLTGQGPSAPGGAYSYLAGDRMIGGFAVIAWPRAYGESGVMSFMVSQSGDVYEKDLGPRTDEAARAIRNFDPGEGWQKSDMQP